MQDTLSLQEADLLQKTSRCVEYIQESLQNHDYETAKIEMSELRFLLDELQAIEQKKLRRAQIFEVVVDMKKRGIQIDDFVSRLLG